MLVQRRRRRCSTVGAAAAILGVDAASSVGRAIADLPIVLLNEQGLAVNPRPCSATAPPLPAARAPFSSGVALPGTAGTQVRMVQATSQRCRGRR